LSCRACQYADNRPQRVRTDRQGDMYFYSRRALALLKQVRLYSNCGLYWAR